MAKLDRGDRYASIFLIGRKAGLDLEDVEKLAEVYRRRRGSRAR